MKKNNPGKKSESPALIGWGMPCLLAVVVAAFLVEVTLAAPGNPERLLRLGALPAWGRLQGQYWRLFTFGLLHWDLLHCAENSVCLLLAGAIVERRLGAGRLIGLFFLASVASGLAILGKTIFFPTTGVAVGASGGTFGLMGAAAVLLERVPATIPWMRFLLWLALTLGIVISFLPEISLAGHIAGLLVGVPLGWLASVPSVGPPPEPS